MYPTRSNTNHLDLLSRSLRVGRSGYGFQPIRIYGNHPHPASSEILTFLPFRGSALPGENLFNERVPTTIHGEKKIRTMPLKYRAQALRYRGFNSNSTICCHGALGLFHSSFPILSLSIRWITVRIIASRIKLTLVTASFVLFSKCTVLPLRLLNTISSRANMIPLFSSAWGATIFPLMSRFSSSALSLLLVTASWWVSIPLL